MVLDKDKCTSYFLPSLITNLVTLSPPTLAMSDELETTPSNLWCGLAITVELIAIISLVAVTKYTVQHRSGLNEPDKLHRIWARAPEIRYQPVVHCLCFSVAVSFGAQTVIFSLSAALLNLLGLSAHRSWLLASILMVLSTGFSAAIAIFVYRATGGDDWRRCFAATYGFNVLMYFLLAITRGLLSMLFSSRFFITVLAFLLPPLIVLGIQSLFAFWAMNRKMPSAARLIYNSDVVPNWVKLDRTIADAAVPLGFFHVLGLVIQRSLGQGTTYLSRVADSLSVLMLLAVSALVSIISVNRALLSNEFQWQWRAFLTPAVPLGIFDVIIMIIRLIFGNYSFGHLLYQAPHLFISYGSCGVLGAYVYLNLAERYARANLDSDDIAQSDILAEFDADEDNEELEV